jgi:hypothetical protein
MANLKPCISQVLIISAPRAGVTVSTRNRFIIAARLRGRRGYVLFAFLFETHLHNDNFPFGVILADGNLCCRHFAGNEGFRRDGAQETSFAGRYILHSTFQTCTGLYCKSLEVLHLDWYNQSIRHSGWSSLIRDGNFP